MFPPEKIQSAVQASLAGAEVQVADMTGTGDHFEVVVVSSAFEGKKLVERHRMVYAAIGPAVGNEIHALALKTWTPDEATKQG
jgi:acid stress-induced BolA-like protein IbaG/YrbA